jgi:hypothetical protein
MSAEGEKWSEHLSDGFHFSSNGNMFVGEKPKELMDNVHPEISISLCPIAGGINDASSKGGLALRSEKGAARPWHDDIDRLEPEKAFEAMIETCKKKRKESFDFCAM